MQTVHIGTCSVYPPIRDFMTVGFICASCQQHRLTSGIVGDFGVDLIRTVIGALDSLTVDWIVRLAISSLGSELPLFLSLGFSVFDHSSLAMGSIICVPSIRLPSGVQDDGEIVE